MARPRLELGTFVADPFAALKEARQAGEFVDTELDTVVATRHERVRELLAEPRLQANIPDFLRSFGVTSGPFYEWMAISPLNRDGADHVRWRQLMSRAFTPRSVERLSPFLRTAAHQLIDGFAARGSCEFMAEFADLYPSLGLCELIGVPSEDRERFRGWADTIGLGFSPIAIAARIAEIDAALLSLLEYTGALAAQRRVEPRDDLVSRIARAADEEGGWSEFEVHGFIAGLVFAGHETTKNQLGWMLAVLVDRRDIWDAIASGSLTAEGVVEEVLRYRSAVTAVGRTVAAPVEYAGERFAPGTRVLLSLWSANHDETAYARAEEIAPAAHQSVPHLAFGHGPHYCLGAALARAELQEALRALTARIECPSVAGETRWRPPVGINGPECLPLRFTARRADG